MGVTKKGAGKHLLLGLAFGGVSVAIYAGISAAFGVLTVNDGIGPLLLIAYFVVYTLSAIPSAVLYEGYYFGAVAASKGTAYAAIACTAVSAVIKLLNVQTDFLSNVNAILVYILGLLLYLYCESIWSVVSLNGVLSLIYSAIFIKIDAPAIFKTVMNVSLFATHLLFIAIIIFMLCRKNKPNVQEITDL